MLKYILVSFVLLIGCHLTQGQSLKTPGKCTGFVRAGNQVTFSCDNGSKVLIQLCSRSVVKVWYSDDGKFERTNPSVAVINERLEEMGTVSVEEQPLAYEIFTDNLRIRVDRDPFHLQVFDKYQKLLLSDFQNKGLIKDGQKVASYKMLRSDEQFFGLGEKAGQLNRRGGTYRMWNSDKPCYSVAEDPLYKSIPFFISSYRFGIFFDNTFKSEFKFGSESSEYYSFEAAGGDLVYYFIFGNDYKQIISRYSDLTGKPIMPPKWAFGFSQSRGMLTSEDLSLDIAKGYRDRKIPCDIIFQDIGWTQFLQDFKWRSGNYKHAPQMVESLKQDGFKVIVSQDPVISKANHRQWSQADSLGYFAADSRTGKTYQMPWPWGGDCGVVDFTNPAVADWWGELQQKPITDGVMGFWTDMGEPAWSNEESVDRLFMKHYIGMHDEVHNAYGLLWDKVVTEQFEKRNPNRRIFQMTRAGYAGLQRYTFGWSGDSGNGNDVLDGWSRLANQVQIGQSAGLGLIPFWSSDISGYCGDIKDHGELAELYIRWLQFGVFNPISRAHHEGNNAVEPWLFGEEAEALSREAIELKYRLFPYLYTYAREAFDTGIPMIRPMLLEFPEDTEAIKAEAQFMLGKELLVAPVVEKDATFKRIYFPAGEWISFTDETLRFKGGQWVEFPVSLKTIPLFVKAGSIVPSMPVMQYIHQQEHYPIILNIYPHQTRKSSFELYEDDGLTNDYKMDIGSRTKITLEPCKVGIKVTVDAPDFRGYKSPQRNYLIEIPVIQKPKEVLINGRKIKPIGPGKVTASADSDFSTMGWSYDKVKQKLTIRIPRGLFPITMELK